MYKTFIFGIIGLILVLTIMAVCLCLRIRNEKLLRESYAILLDNFQKGNPGSMNPKLALNEQANRLPYDEKYEFPREKLRLSDELGSGESGVVVKAQAQGILPDEEETTVAVKIVKKKTDNEVFSIFDFFFQIQHDNV